MAARDQPWNHNIHYHPLILRAMPAACGRALDAGCGRGLLTRKLAEHATHVVGMDLDAEALDHAIAEGDAGGHIEYVRGDVMTADLAPASFDFIAAVATLHHLPLKPALQRFAMLLEPGGVLAIIGLFRAQSVFDYAIAAGAIPTSLVLQFFRGHAEVGAPVRDPDETFPEIRSVTRAVLPGAIVRRRLLFRYALVWRKPG